MYLKEKNLAIEIVKQAGEMAMKDFLQRETLDISIKQADNESKHHLSPVSETDHRIERFVKESLLQHFPTYGIIWEEYWHENIGHSYKRIIDPIDGTKEFIRGKKEWGVLLALQHNADIVLWISYMPAYNELLRAVSGQGAWCGNTRLWVSTIDELQSAHICHEKQKYYIRDGIEKEFNALTTQVRSYHTKSLTQLHYLVKGNIDAAIGAQAYLYDYAPFICLIQEAGWQATQLNGKNLGDEYASYLFSNGLLHEKLVRFFSNKHGQL